MKTAKRRRNSFGVSLLKQYEQIVGTSEVAAIGVASVNEQAVFAKVVVRMLGSCH